MLSDPSAPRRQPPRSVTTDTPPPQPDKSPVFIGLPMPDEAARCAEDSVASKPGAFSHSLVGCALRCVCFPLFPDIPNARLGPFWGVLFRYTRASREIPAAPVKDHACDDDRSSLRGLGHPHSSRVRPRPSSDPFSIRRPKSLLSRTIGAERNLPRRLFGHGSCSGWPYSSPRLLAQ